MILFHFYPFGKINFQSLVTFLQILTSCFLNFIKKLMELPQLKNNRPFDYSIGCTSVNCYHTIS